MAEFRSVRGKGRIRTIIEILSLRVPEKGRICVSTGKWKNPGDYPEKVEFHVSIDKLSRRVSKKSRICVSTEKWQNPDQYREKVESVRVSTNCPGAYQKRVESV